MDATATALVALELEQRVRAVSVVAGSIRLEPQASSFLRWARGLTDDVGAGRLLASCSGLEQFMHAAPDRADEAARSAHTQLSELTLELKSFSYFAATVIEYFDGIVLAQEQIDAASSSSAWAQIELLMVARAASSGNPRVGWGLISAFAGCRA